MSIGVPMTCHLALPDVKICPPIHTGKRSALGLYRCFVPAVANPLFPPSYLIFTCPLCFALALGLFTATACQYFHKLLSPHPYNTLSTSSLGRSNLLLIVEFLNIILDSTAFNMSARSFRVSCSPLQVTVTFFLVGGT